MDFIPQLIPEVLLVKPTLHQDGRGYFFEVFKKGLLERLLGYPIDFVQDNESKSECGVVRGLHAQAPPFAQSKLVRVVQGRVLDVALDIRRGSPTFGKHVAAELSGENKHQLFVPRGFAHGFAVLSDDAIVSYKVDSAYSPGHEIGISALDEDMKIDWGLPKSDIRMSSKDHALKSLREIVSPFLYHHNYYA